MSSKSETLENLERMKRCPRFEFCSAPKCPLDELVDQRIQLGGEPTCPYTTRLKSRRVRPIPKQVRKFLKPDGIGGFKSAFGTGSPEVGK